MSNETQTPASQPDSAQGQGSNGFDNVAAQYRAMQEAQILHEETINQLREEIRGQREKIAELAKANPSSKGGQVDVLMLRLTELERKMGEGAPDPLINEIVHRLAALENNGPARGAKDPRVDEVYKQLDDLRQQMENAGAKDARTDDVVLRIASLEGAFRRAAQSRDPEEVQARIDSLAEELASRQEAELADLRKSFGEAAQAASQAAEQSAGNSAAEAALENLTSRLEGAEERLGKSASLEQLTALGEQLAALDRKLSEQPDAEIESRVKALEEREAPVVDLSAVTGRLESLESKFSGQPDAEIEARVKALEEKPAAEADLSGVNDRLESVERKLEDGDTSQRLLELAGRLRSLENKLEAGPADTGDLQRLNDRLEQLEQSAAPKTALTDIARLDAELRSLQSLEGKPDSDSGGDLAARLAELEERVTDAESASRLEDAHARLGKLETKWESLGDPQDVGRRLTVLELADKQADPRVEELVQRLAALETKAQAPAVDGASSELRSHVAELRAQFATLSKTETSNELASRLSSLEEKVGEIASRPAAESTGEPQDVSGLRDEVRSLALRLEQLAEEPPKATAQDPRVSELAARIDYVERRAQSLSSSVDLDDLSARLEKLEQAAPSASGDEELSSGVKAEIAARLGALEEAVAQGKAGGDADFEGLLRKETERWNQWARSTIDEIGEIRGRVDSLGGSGSGIDAESLESLSIQISNGLNTSEVKALRAQMYFVYLALGVVWALLMYVLFTG